MSGHAEKISSERVLDGVRLVVEVDQVIEPHADSPARREVVRHAGAAAIVPCLPGGKVLLVRQYRYAPDAFLWEVPAGVLDPGETPEQCAERELAEETGYRLGSLELLTGMYPSPGFSDEMIHIFRADNLEPGLSNPDPGEHFELKTFTMHEALEMISAGRIIDSKTMVGILLVARDIRK